MIRVVGYLSIATAIAIIAFRVGYQSALYWATPMQLAEAARLRIEYYMGCDPAKRTVWIEEPEKTAWVPGSNR